MPSERKNPAWAGDKVIVLPFGKPLVAVPVEKAVFFPGTRDYVVVASRFAERIREDGYALVVFPNPETGVASSVATLAALEIVNPIEGSENFQLGLHFIYRARIADFKHTQHPQGKMTEIIWELLEEEEITSASWNKKDVKEQFISLQREVKKILDRAPDALEQRFLTVLRAKMFREDDQRKAEEVLYKLVTAFDSLKRVRRELLGPALDAVAHALFELYYILKEEKPSKEGLKLVSNVFHTVLIEERLRRLLKFTGWLVDNFEFIIDGEEETEETGTKEAVENEKGVVPPQIAALLARYQIVESHMPEEARQEFERELKRLIHGGGKDSAVETRLERIVSLPWEKRSSPPADLRGVKAILDKDHAHLEKVKDRILEFVAVRMLNPRAKGRVLCFVGPRGVGKTSLGKSIARALGKKFVHLALGGLDDVADLRGHHHTYLNAAPGFIMSLIRKCGERDCVFMLDEVDKTGKNWRGDPASALVEILDPEQNYQFRDHYLDVPFDLSEVLFITTANVLVTINSTLMDRLEVIEIPGYTDLEKLEIAKQHLIPRRRAENGFPIVRLGLPQVDVVFADSAILELINSYTREAGVRWLERELDMIFRKVGKAIALQDLDIDGIVEISEANVSRYCGNPKFSESDIPKVLPTGTVPVLAVSETGGSLFIVEVVMNRHPGRRKIAMKGVRYSGEGKDTVNQIAESLEKAVDALISDGKILFDAFKALEEEEWLCPAIIGGSLTNGAIPKDGPSAGLSLFLAVYGALTRKSIKPRVEVPLLAATGEIDVNLDTVGKIGGLRDKILAAARHGVKLCLVPKANEADLEDVPEEIRAQMKIIPVEDRWEALMIAYPEDRERIKAYLENRSL